MADVYQLPADRLADEELIAEVSGFYLPYDLPSQVLRKGHTRVPVHDAKVKGAYM
jgi:hypothetical protein